MKKPGLTLRAIWKKKPGISAIFKNKGLVCVWVWKNKGLSKKAIWKKQQRKMWVNVCDMILAAVKLLDVHDFF